MSSFACFYFGPPKECTECGFYDATGTGFCSHDCAAARADRVARQDADRQAQRDREDEFAREGARLREQGYTDREIDDLLAHIPT